MINTKFLIKVGLGLLLALAVGMAVSPAPKSKNRYARALSNFQVTTASASPCHFGLKCVGNPINGACRNGNDPSVGCIGDPGGSQTGCFGCQT